jgi:hypothetical protein
MNALSKTFDSDNIFSIRALSGIDARDHRLALDKNSARATLGFFTTDLRPGEAQSLAQKC